MVTDEGVGVGLVEILEPGTLGGAADPVLPILEGGQRLIEATRQGGDIPADERTVDGHEVVPGDGGDDRPSAPRRLRHPRLVRLAHGVPSFPAPRRREVSNGRIDDSYLLVLRQMAYMALQLARLDEIVGIKELEILSAPRANAEISGGRQATVVLMHVVIAGVSTDIRLDDRLGIVRRAVVDDDAFPAGVRLTRQALQGFGKEMTVVEAWDDDGHESRRGGGHSSNLCQDREGRQLLRAVPGLPPSFLAVAVPRPMVFVECGRFICDRDRA